MKQKIIILSGLTILFLFTLWLRLYKIDALSLYIDESIGHYLLNTVEIQKAAASPFGLVGILFWRSYSLTWLFGYSILGVRVLSAIYGAMIPLSMCLVLLVICKNKRVLVILTAILTAILPWNFIIGRIGYSNIPLIVNLILFHLYFFLRAQTVRGYLVSLLFLLLALPYYQSMVIIIPIASLYVLLAILRIANKKEKSAVLGVGFILVILMAGPVADRFRLSSVSGRALDLAIWRDVNTVHDTDKYRALSWDSKPSLFSFNLPPEQLANKLFLNRITANLSIFTKNYLSFFSPDWLFLRGDSILRHSIGMVGAFYPFLLPFMFYGAFRFFKTTNQKTKSLFLVWILISPIPAAITKDGAGYLLRAVTLLPFLTYFCALGVVDSFGLITKRLRPFYLVALLLVGVYSSWSFFYGYFHVYPALSVRAYEYGFRELSDFQAINNGASMLVVWDGYYHNGDFRFWQKTPFEQFESFKVQRLQYGQSIFWQTWPNLYFSNPKSAFDVENFVTNQRPSYLVLPDRYFVKYPVELETKYTNLVKTIRYPDGTDALRIYQAL